MAAGYDATSISANRAPAFAVNETESEIEKVAQPGPYRAEAFWRDLSGDSGDPIAGEGARLLGRDPRRSIKAAWPAHRNMIRPSSVNRRDREDDHEHGDRVEVTRRGDHEHGSMASVLAATHRLERRPGDNARRELRIAHAVKSVSSVRSQSVVSDT